MKIEKKRIIQGVSISVGLAVLGVFALNGWALNQKAGEDSVVVTVNETKITRGQVDEKIGEMLGPQAGMIPPEKMVEVRNQVDGKVIENMIIEALLTDAVNKQGITVNDQEIDDALTKIRETVPPDVDFQEYLKEKGLSEQKLRKMLSQDLRIRKLLEGQLAGISSPTDGELMTFYKENADKFKSPENKETTVPFSEAKKSISDYLLGQKKQDAVRAYIDGLKTGASIVYNRESPETKNPT
ncbi:MAG TPA: hypothetical protein HPP90_09705 [Deltaproteobacteria bacterium]|nr:hypothetical protein [Deltaproteobacteria bacterium]